MIFMPWIYPISGSIYAYASKHLYKAYWYCVLWNDALSGCVLKISLRIYPSNCFEIRNLTWFNDVWVHNDNQWLIHKHLGWQTQPSI